MTKISFFCQIVAEEVISFFSQNPKKSHYSTELESVNSAGSGWKKSETLRKK